MAEVVERLADKVLVTDDNPRTEDPSVSSTTFVPALKRWITSRSSPVVVRPSRRSSLRRHAADVIVLAGKGHEDYQEIDGQRHPFSDLEEAAKALTHGRPHMLKPLSFSELSLPLDARRVGDDCSFTGVSIDSRNITPGQLFVALTGPRFDGHDYLNKLPPKVR